MNYLKSSFLSLIWKNIPGGRGQLVFIDLVRGLASIGILIVHYKHFLGGSSPPIETINQVQYFALWSPIYYWGSNLVQLFWLISGFIFVHVYGNRSDVSTKEFFISRFARLYPLHFITLILITLLQWYSTTHFNNFKIYEYNDAYHFILNILFASEWGFQSGRSFNGPIWSVSVEIFSYILFFLIIKNFRLNLLSIVSSLIISIVIYSWLHNSIVLCSIYFFFGCLTYGFMQYLIIYTKKYAIFLSALLLISSSCLFLLKNIPLLFIYMPFFGSLILFLSLVEKHVGSKYLTGLSWIGDTSYGNYLWHSPLQVLFLLFVSEQLIDINIVYSGYFLLAYMTIVISVSVISFKYIEKPLQKYIRNCF